MLIRFISHAGISIEEQGYSILIDPWFFDSTPEYPVIQSIGGEFDTIDFQIPKTSEHIERYTPDAIAVSHFHPHHSPARDIRILCEASLANKKEIQLLHPTPNPAAEAVLKERVPQGVKRRSLEPEESVTVGPLTICAKEHTVPFHRAWHVYSATGSVLHIGDGRLHKDPKIREVDAVWRNLQNLSPSVLFLSTGGHNVRITKKDGSRDIQEAGIFTPVEAAQVARIIAPKAVAAFGFYNHSIWKNRVEYILPSSQSEEEFQWAVSWLMPQTHNVRLLPGYTFGIGDSTLINRCDTYLET